MKIHSKRHVTMPNVKDTSISYVLNSIKIAKNGCYDDQKRLYIDGGFGDYNINLFRLRNKRKFIRDIPSSFTPTIKDLLEYKINDRREQRIATQYNCEIKRILNQPKEIYIQKIKQEKIIEEKKKADEKQRNQYVIGWDSQTRQVNQHLSFNYLPRHQAEKWFKIKDNSPNYIPPEPLNLSQVVFSKTQPKMKVKTGNIFLSDNKDNRFFRKNKLF